MALTLSAAIPISPSALFLQGLAHQADFRYAGLLHQSGHAINETAFDTLSAHFNPEEIVELTAVASAFEFFSRFNSALRIPVTPLPGENLRLDADTWQSL